MNCVSFMNFLGYHSVATLATACDRNIDDNQEDVEEFAKQATTLNILNLLGYIPGLGVATGCKRLYATHQDENTDEHGKANELERIFHVYSDVRAVLEIIGCGLLFLIPDMIMTIGHHCCVRTSKESSTAS